MSRQGMSDIEHLEVVIKHIIDEKKANGIEPAVALRADVLSIWDEDIHSLNDAVRELKANGSIVVGVTINSEYYKLKQAN